MEVVGIIAVNLHWNPIFSGITSSSVWRQPDHVRLAWIAILANKDFKTHVVRTNALILADQARISRENAEDAIRVLCEPDADSLDPEFGGRRLEKLPTGGYRVLNGEKYSKLMSEFKKREYDRQFAAAKRAAAVTTGNGETVGNGVKRDETPAITKRHEMARPILHYLNEKAGVRYRETETNLAAIGARLAEPEVTADGCRLMIDRMVQKWKGTEQADFLRPTTLFGKEKFDGYYAAREQPIVNGTQKELRGGKMNSEGKAF